MGFSADPELIDRLAGQLRTSTGRLSKSHAPPEADAGPSSVALAATVAELMRATAGVIETATRAAEDLHTSRATYVNTDDANLELFRQQDRLPGGGS